MSEWTDETAQAMRARCESATEGPWHAYAPRNKVIYIRNGEGIYVMDGNSYAVRLINDADFIAHARTDLPLALDALARQQEANVRLTEMLRGEQSTGHENDSRGVTDETCEDRIKREVGITAIYHARSDRAEAALAERDATIARLRDELVKEELLHDEQLRRALTAKDDEILRLREALEQILAHGMNTGAVAGENFALMLAKIRSIVRDALTPAKEADR